MENKNHNHIDTHSNYSIIDGKDLTYINNNSFTVKRVENNTCPSCHLENSKYNNYCKFCGSNLEEVIEKKEYNNNIKDIILKNQFISKEEFLTGIAAVGILFILSIIVDFAISTQSNELGKIINPIQIMAALNLGTLDIYSSTIVGFGAMNIKIGILILLLPSIIAISISNIIFMKNKKSRTLLSSIIGVSLTYGLAIAIISIFASMTINYSQLLQYGTNVKIKFDFITVFVNGFIIAALCTYAIGVIKQYKNENLCFKTIDLAIKAIVTGYVLVLTIVTLLDKTYLYDLGLYGYSKDFSMIIVLTQLASYLWAFANIIPITIGSFSMSAFNIINSSLSLDTKLIMYSLIALSLLIILITGYKLKDRYEKNNIKPVINFAISYSLLMGGFSLLSNISISGKLSLLGSQNYLTAIEMGFPLITTIVISFIYSFLIALIGYKLNDNSQLG